MHLNTFMPNEAGGCELQSSNNTLFCWTWPPSSRIKANNFCITQLLPQGDGSEKGAVRHGEPGREDVLGREARGRGVVRGGAHAPALPRRLGVPEVRQPQARPGGGQAEEAPVHAPRAAAPRDLRDPDAGVAAAAAEVVPGVPARRRLEGGRPRRSS
jgi:hypothetical protein